MKWPTFSKKNKEKLDQFVVVLGSKKAQLFKEPLLYQYGSVFLEPGEVATDKQIWYMKKLLMGMKAKSASK